MASLEKGRQVIEAKGSTRGYFSCLIVTETVMLTLITTSIADRSQTNPSEELL
jgi:hypothetical protein